MKTTSGTWEFQPSDEQPLIIARDPTRDPEVDVVAGLNTKCLRGTGLAPVNLEEVNANGYLLAAAKQLRTAAEKAYSLLDSILALKGTGLEVSGYHLNGEKESFDALIEDDMNGDELEMLRAAIAASYGPQPKPEPTADAGS